MLIFAVHLPPATKAILTAAARANLRRLLAAGDRKKFLPLPPVLIFGVRLPPAAESNSWLAARAVTAVPPTRR